MFKQSVKFPLIGGYSKTYLAANRIFSIILALALIIAAAPFFVIIAAAIRLQSGSPVFYKGKRLGLNKKLYTMYKFRTLQPEAEKIVGARTLSPRHGLVTPIGKFLRDTRLDELPQLFNVIKGDMDFVGPRPERPIIYEKICKNIKGYDLRFTVKPGLIGYSQLFTPHSSPKALRTLIDNCFLKKKQKFAWDIFIVSYTAMILARTIIVKGARFIWNNIFRKRLLHIYREKRTFERVRQHHDATAYIGTKTEDGEVFHLQARLVDVNEEAFLIMTNQKIDQKSVTMDLHKDLFVKMQTTYTPLIYRTILAGLQHLFQPAAKTKRRKTKIARCRGAVYRETELRDSPYRYLYVIKYTPISPFNHYMVHQYFLEESVVSK